MLTSRDLDQIRLVVNNVIEDRVPKIVSAAIEDRVPKIVSAAIGDQVPGIVDKKLFSIKRDLKKIRADLEMAVGILDRNRWELEQRVNKMAMVG